MLQIYNSLTNGKEPFRPIEAGRVRMYVCGMTVYDYCHLGHARVMIAFDVVVRYLRARGYEVTYVRNITDIDDKIIKRAHEDREPVEELTARFIEAMHQDAAALGNLTPDHEPRATEHIPQIIAMVKGLIDKGYAYVGATHDVYYDVSRFKHYGKLSGKDPQELRAGARVEIAEAKDDPLDFVLWKAAKPDEPAWDSPWGPGRPGWHIECSAMSMERLGAYFDIHGGGMDLQFPHHENEIAQSEACSGQQFVNYWMHNGFVRVDDEKMSKSLGNFFTVRDVLQHYTKRYGRPEIASEMVRYLIVASHYRSPLNYTKGRLDAARAALASFYVALRDLPHANAPERSVYQDRFVAAMDDDFNTPEALAVLSDLETSINKADKEQRPELGAELRKLGGILGLLQDDPDKFLKGWVTADFTSPVEYLSTISQEQVGAMIDQRAGALAAKNWAEADRIRDRLKENGVILEDHPDSPTTWRRE